ncbi:MAG: hypothetical protein L0Y73_02365, partial [Candidatus Aminicenantes bacterium]|nr:hypothetical protein [Candidatus Aminicenantes bacterium]
CQKLLKRISKWVSAQSLGNRRRMEPGDIKTIQGENWRVVEWWRGRVVDWSLGKEGRGHWSLDISHWWKREKQKSSLVGGMFVCSANHPKSC